jgi:tetratricopeptide (TPR) repeat protein
MSAYRQGRYQEAIDWAQKTLASDLTESHAKAYAILAMAYWQLGQHELAEQMLAEGNSLAPASALAGQNPDLGHTWVTWVGARVSLDEAAALLGAKPAYASSPLDPKPE